MRDDNKVGKMPEFYSTKVKLLKTLIETNIV